MEGKPSQLRRIGIRAGHARGGSQAGSRPLIRSGSGNRAATFAIRLPAVQMARQAVRQSEPGNEKLSDINPITCYAHTPSLSSALLLFVIAFPLSLHFHYLSLPLSDV